MGWTLPQVRDECASREGKWMVRGDEYACFGKKTELLGGIHEFRFCEKQLCSVNAVVFLLTKDSDGWAQAFDMLAKDIESRIGPPQDADVRIPEECNSELFECLTDGRAHLLLSWHSPTRVLFLRMGKTGDGAPAISTYFATMEGAQLLGKGPPGPYRPAPME
jgi:hypothetical protein